MELKPIKAENMTSEPVLIEPLWNWNSDTDKILKPGFVGINRTFMELKRLKVIDKAEAVIVLIEPLWNWNMIRSLS